MKKLSKLKCFQCNHPFQWVHHYTHEIRTEPIWRWNGQPYCKDCVRDSLDTLYMNDDLILWFLDQMDTERYHRDYDKFMQDVMTVNCPNPKCRCSIYVWKLDKNYDGKTYGEVGSEMACPDCHWFFSFDKLGKIETYAINEETYYTNENHANQTPPTNI